MGDLVIWMASDYGLYQHENTAFGEIKKRT